MEKKNRWFGRDCLIKDCQERSEWFPLIEACFCKKHRIEWEEKVTVLQKKLDLEKVEILKNMNFDFESAVKWMKDTGNDIPEEYLSVIERMN